MNMLLAAQMARVCSWFLGRFCGGIGFILRQDPEIAALALERVDAGLTEYLVSVWSFRPENADTLAAILEEQDNPGEPQKF
jgi:hypothetical protein